MKKFFKTYILIILILMPIISAGCNNSKLTNNKNIEPESKKVINEVITTYITTYYSHILTNTDKVFEAHKIYTIEQKNGLINVYIYTLFKGYSFANGKFSSSQGGSNPAVIVLSKNNGKFTVVKFKQPEDGDEYRTSIKKMFPPKYAEEVMKDTGRDLGLETQIKLEAKEWLKTQGRSESLSEK